jgi:DNA-binding transcriptional regulator YhcF (GntR family)
MTPSTKVDLNHSKIARMEGLDELSIALFPNNKNHQRTFLAIFVDLKWAEGQFLPSLEHLADKHGISPRTLETVRAKMRRLGIIDHVSRFNKRHEYREGWVFSKRFERSLKRLAELLAQHRTCRDTIQEEKDRDLHRYL